MIGSELAQAFLRCIAWDAADASISLADALKAAIRARYTETRTGKTLVGTSSNGTSVSFTVPSGISPAEILGTLNYLYRLYTITAAAADVGTADATLLATMLEELGPANSFTNDYSGLRAEETEVVSG